MSRQFKYERFEKLSDAVKAEDEDGIDLYVRRENGTYYILDSQEHGFEKHLNYYRRIEVKPFECWAIVWDDGKLAGVLEGERPPAIFSNQRLLRLREVKDEN